MIDIICNDIQKAIDAGAYISALSLALTLPDWCGKAEYPDEFTTSRYKKWYSENVGKYETCEGYTGSYSSADVVYSLRNHIFHQGTLSYNKDKVHQEQNKVENFTLYFNKNECDGGSSTIRYCGDTEKIEGRAFEVNALNLIMKLMSCARGYFENNKEKFGFLNITILEKG